MHIKVYLKTGVMFKPSLRFTVFRFPVCCQFILMCESTLDKYALLEKKSLTYAMLLEIKNKCCSLHKLSKII